MWGCLEVVGGGGVVGHPDVGVVGEGAATGLEVGEGGLVQEAGHARKVNICVAFEVSGEVALVVSGASEEAPAGVGEGAGGEGEGAEVVVEGGELGAVAVEVGAELGDGGR